MNDISYIIKTKEFKLFKGQSKNKNVDCSTPKLLNSFNYIADKLQEHYSSVCKIYDEAPDFCCFEKKYLIHPSSSFRDELIILITTSKVLRKYGMQYVSIIKYISLLGRFLFANYTLIREKKDCFLSSFSELLENALSILYKASWPFKDTIIVKLLVLNLLDSFCENKEDVLRKIVGQSIDKEYNPVSYEILNETVDSYLKNAVLSALSINSIEKDWIYAYIYKKRFGYIYCRDFILENKDSSLFSMKIFSLSNKDLKQRIVFTAPKVVLFEAGNNKRSSNYVPTEDSVFFNTSTMRFE